ncbi:hypothetical protein HK103_000376 [Boothiomyces macroporosus]|uniref:Uncharacterized protein n=1 Tax=Boothiomyces macroporosus TaxID=261099 RepID=A0AAD5Y5N2_9FUNG|nr:hypothetical protein HK103_000376 [Boothiomyces macroporosus]
MTIEKQFALLLHIRKDIKISYYTTNQKILLATKIKQQIEYSLEKHSHFDDEYPDINALERIDIIISHIPILSDKEFHYHISNLLQAIRNIYTPYSIPGNHRCYKLHLAVQFKLRKNELYISKFSSIIRVLRYSSNALDISVGDKVLLINGIETMDYVNQNKWVEAPVNSFTQSIINAMSFRDCARMPLPETDTMELVLERLNGKAYTVDLPWVAEFSQ